MRLRESLSCLRYFASTRPLEAGFSEEGENDVSRSVQAYIRAADRIGHPH